MADPAVRRLSYAEHLDRERHSGVEHAYLDGEAVAMAGARRTARWSR